MDGNENKVVLNDKVIRKAFIKTNLEFFKQQGCYFVNEYGLSGKNSKNIVDLALFDFNRNILYCFEIKGEHDKLQATKPQERFKTRFSKQLATYTGLFNVVYMIITECHLKNLQDYLDKTSHCKNVGIILVDKDLKFTEIKKATYNKVSFSDFISNLDKEEIQLLCVNKKFPAGGSKFHLIEQVKRHVSYEDLYSSLRNKIRKYYYKRCSCCGSTLYYNRYSNGVKYSICYECGGAI